MSTTSAGGLRALSGSLVAITTLAAGLRFYTRRVQRAKLEADDWMIIPAYLSFIGMVACALYGVNLGIFGLTDAQVVAEKIAFNVEVALVVSLDCLSTACLGFTRISALIFYRRIFCVSGQPKQLATAIYITIIITSLWIVAFIILPPLQCGPDLSVWSAPSAVRAKYCGKGNQIILGFSISDMLIETVVIALPIPNILQLKTSVRRRVAVLFVFITAFVSYGANLARLAIVSQLLHNQLRDRTSANTTQTFMWILEAGFAFIAINLPSLWWLRHKVRPESVLASVRSAFALSSLRSSRREQTGLNSGKAEPYKDHDTSEQELSAPESTEVTAGGAAEGQSRVQSKKSRDSARGASMTDETGKPEGHASAGSMV